TAPQPMTPEALAQAGTPSAEVKVSGSARSGGPRRAGGGRPRRRPQAGSRQGGPRQGPGQGRRQGGAGRARRAGKPQ
ncbi:MAG TPA: hypothetical protein VNP20_00430, partial [Nocardioidaceae bacterium]|nr:hypothetical protein [Nocardioidaceae bacterium]